MRILSPLSTISLSGIYHLHIKPIIPFLFLLSSSICTSSSHTQSSISTSSPTQTSTSISNPNPNPNPKSNHRLVIIKYLIDSFGLSKTRANAISNRFSWIKYPEQPQSVVNYLRKLGFTDTQIRSTVNVSPQLLFARMDKTLRPKLEFFQDLGFVGPDLGEFISKNSCVLTHSLTNRLIPCSQILKNILMIHDDKNEKLIRVLRRCRWIMIKNPHSSLLCNAEYLRSCGIVGSQLSMLLTRQPSLFLMKQSKLTELVSQVVAMGFPINSRMLVYALYTVSCISDTTFNRKIHLFSSFGFSKDECMEMFRRAPGLLRVSEEKLKFGIEFLMNTIKFSKSSLVRHPKFFMYSMENRVIPRYKVLQLIKSRTLLKKEPSYTNVIFYISEVEFLEKFISRFRDDAEELLIAYKGHLLDSEDE